MENCPVCGKPDGEGCSPGVKIAMCCQCTPKDRRIAALDAAEAEQGSGEQNRLVVRVAELEQEVRDHQSIEQGHLHLIAELRSQLKLKS